MKFFLETLICILLSIIILVFILCCGYTYYKRAHNPVEKIVQEFVEHTTGVDIDEIIVDDIETKK